MKLMIVEDNPQMCHDDRHWRAAACDAGACGYVLKDDLLEVRPPAQCQA